MAVEDKMIDIIVEQLSVDRDKVVPGASFVDDLGADSLDLVELIMAMEEEFDVEIPDEEAEKIVTVQNAIDFVAKIQELKRGRYGVKRRVVVTGIGLITPLGIGTEQTWNALINGQSGIGPITRFDASDQASQIAAEVKGFNPEDWFEKKQVKNLDPFVQYAVAAADIAWKNSGLSITDDNVNRVGVITGCGMGGLPTIEEYHGVLLSKGPRKITPFFIPRVIPNMPSGHISMRIGCKGPNLSQTTACAAGTHAVGEAFRHIAYGDCDVAITGGTESVICPLAVGGFSAMKALSTRNDDPTTASRPFDRDRDGFVISEGSGMLVLEETGGCQTTRRHHLC